jgi:hypothetical protein
MEIQNLLIFVLIGAVCMVIVTGGALSMTSDTSPEPTALASGAAFGAALGGAASYLMKSDITTMIGGGLESFSSMTGGDDTPVMKVGLPSF